ncbi:MAG TPA: hypothetical protein VIM98_08610, partial [Dyella sp.]|uniref:hypothetical protein n=1 Tax=Dyella sp. TaxID=1869338 RepID=UPI002F9431CF
MDGKALLVVALCALAANGRTTEQPANPNSQSYVSSAETTYVWKYLGVRLIETYGQVGEGPRYTGSWKQQSFREKDGLLVTVHAASFDRIDAARVAALTQSAYNTVAQIAGKPPVRKVELYLTPAGTS